MLPADALLVTECTVESKRALTKLAVGPGVGDDHRHNPTVCNDDAKVANPDAGQPRELAGDFRRACFRYYDIGMASGSIGTVLPLASVSINEVGHWSMRP